MYDFKFKLNPNIWDDDFINFINFHGAPKYFEKKINKKNNKIIEQYFICEDGEKFYFDNDRLVLID